MVAREKSIIINMIQNQISIEKQLEVEVARGWMGQDIVAGKEGKKRKTKQDLPKVPTQPQKATRLMTMKNLVDITKKSPTITLTLIN